jgi:hypothetical protein
MTSYPEQGSTGIQPGGPPRTAEVLSAAAGADPKRLRTRALVPHWQRNGTKSLRCGT